MKKLTLTLDQTNWLEATWVEEITTQVEGEEDRVETTQVHCESFSGHPEHIKMLRAKATEFGTSLDEYEAVIAECESKFVYPSDEELLAYENANKVAEAKVYLTSTDFYMTVDKYASLTPERQVELTTKRAEARELINTLEAELITLQ